MQEIVEKLLEDYKRQYEFEKGLVSSHNSMSPRYAISRYAELLRLETAVKVLETVLREAVIATETPPTP